MARTQAPGAPRRVVLAAVLVVVLAAAAVAFYLVWGRDGAVSAEELDRVLIVAASPDEDGSVVAQVIVVADLSADPAALEPVSPARAATIPGTTYSTLADAYPFGGGGGVAEALARAEGGASLPFVALDAEQFSAAVKEAGGMKVTLPAAMSVFDGEDLYTFKAGTHELTADEVRAVLKGAPYLTEGERARLDAELGSALAALLADQPAALTDADTDLDEGALEALRLALGSVAR